MDRGTQSKIHLLPVCELAGYAESRLEALDLHANYPDLPLENERGRMAWNDQSAFQMLSWCTWLLRYTIEAAAADVVGFSFERKLSFNPPELEVVAEAES